MKAFALFSGGLDSSLSVLWMKKLGFEVIPVFFRTPFFEPDKALAAAKEIDMSLTVFDITDEHLKMLENPRYGFGKRLNPCIDCHGLMFRILAEKFEEFGVSFVISGEVLGQRPMSQRKDALNAVGKLSGIKDLIIRPLSQKLLADTQPIINGWVNKDDLLDIQGRTRKRQFELAAEFGLKEFAAPGGGCLLTDKMYTQKLKDLIDNSMAEKHFIEFLGVGRHFRLSPTLKMIMGRTERDNEKITTLATNDLILKVKTHPGPLAVLNCKTVPAREELNLAASLLLSYCHKAPSLWTVEYGEKFRLNASIEVAKQTQEIIKKYRIG